MWRPVLGYVSGYNVFGPDVDGGASSTIDPQALYSWIDQRCTADPLMDLVTVTNKLIIELYRHRPAR